MIIKLHKIPVDPKAMRSFGITMGTAFTILSIFLLWKNNQYYVFPCLLAITFFLFGFLFPKVLIPFYKLWMRLSEVMSIIMTTILLSLLFFTILTPISLIAKLLNKKFLNEIIDKKQTSYWVYVKQTKDNNYDKQF